ncbi:N-acetylmuramoyl-L-alanine amidase [uncultured Shimia sp.]|uniref:N-acetylmuramoyl-L-alanine amidase n=1 Tax=uncultured Shimia sp. TaxID=573152 RepID=UPI0025EAAAB1|nr:N-acetylmuramoyl-L-alanine amidase [uncultured Shimia sp.]
MPSKTDILHQPSPNFGERRDGQRPELIVIHYTAMDSAQAAIDWLCNPEAEVSAHYVIAPDGHVTQLVAEEMRAWHAGVGSWQGQSDVNSRSIGIELSNKGDHPFSAKQMDALEVLLRGIKKRWGIGPDGVIGHSDMSPGRKIDPGPKFDWQRLARQELAIWPDQGNADADWESCAKNVGYDLENPNCFAAFRARFRPWAEGPCDAEDARIAARLGLVARRD